MTTRWDLVVRDRNDRPVVAIEVDATANTSPQWAAQFRRNLSKYGDLPDLPYLLMVFPDRLYLWKNNDHAPGIVEPTYIVDARPFFQPYFDRAGVTVEQISGDSLELILASWLTTVMLRRPEELNGAEKWLIQSGLYDVLTGGKIEYEVVA